MRIRGLVGLAGLVLVAVGVGYAVGWPWGLVTIGVGLYLDTLTGNKQRNE